MPPRRHIAWIACCAVLFNLLAMPLTSAATKARSDAWLWGAFCSNGGAQAVPALPGLAKVDLGRGDDPHAAMQHCWCCSGSAPLVGLPSGLSWVQHPMAAQFVTAAPAALSPRTPRQQWPALNPRASPLV